MKPASIPFEAIGLNAREHLRVTALAVELATQRRMENLMRMSEPLDPRDPTQVPPGDLSDAVKPDLPADFEEDSDEDEYNEPDDDEDDE